MPLNFWNRKQTGWMDRQGKDDSARQARAERKRAKKEAKQKREKK